MVVISINQKAREVLLSISGFEIFPSLAKAHSDIKFFSNVVLRKTITEKQFLYLVSAVLQSIIGYRLQFSCVSKGVCEKWDKMLRKSLKLKANLLKDFPNKALYHPELYGLKTFKQVLAKNLLAGLLLIDLVNCFLTGATCALKLCNLSLGSNLPNVFQARNSIVVLDVLSFESYLGIVKSLKRYGINTFCRWKKLDPRDPVSIWFVSLAKFIVKDGLLNCVLLFPHSVSTDSSCDFGYVGEHLLNSGLGSITIYTDGFIKNLGLLGAYGGATAYFLNIDTSVGIKMDGLLLSILVELQTIALALKCVLASQSVNLYMNSQALLDLCKSASGLAGPDFFRNECANFYADAAVTSGFFLSLMVPYHFLNVESRSVSGNTCHVAKKLFNTARCVGGIISVSLSSHFDKVKTFCVWHSDGRIRFGYTSTVSATLWSYFIKVLYHCLPMAIRKKKYNLNYLNIACIQYGLVKDSDHVFSCICDVNVWDTLLSDATLEWNELLGTFVNKNAVANLLLETASSIDLFTALAKSFVLKSWMVDTLGHLNADSSEGALIVNFIYHFAENYRSAIWLPAAKLKSYYEKYNFLPCDGSSISLVSDLSSLWSAGTIRDFRFRLGIYVCFGLYLCLTRSDFGFLCDVPVVKNLDIFGFRKSCLFFSGIEDMVSVHIDA
ncbi:hypothetical protein G9A89_014747 [Geosiphon pyriformis]|nr:hypothetical protein G9A89_014747 [Geosiphon pyriformis]